MRIYVTDLAAYNGGHLVGVWVELPMDEEKLKLKLDKLLVHGSKLCGDGEVHEEYFITDWECKLFNIGEHENIYCLNEKASKVKDFNEDERLKVNFLLSHYLVSSFDEAIEKIEDVTIHKESTMRSVAEEYMSEHFSLDSLPPMVRNNIDFEGVANDLDNQGNYFELNGDVFEYRGA